MRLRLTPDAEQDITDIFVYGVLTYGLKLSEEYSGRLQGAIDRLGDYPMLGREHDEINPPVRLYRYESHHILYAIRDGELLVLRVLHGSVDWISLLGH
ncbi:type II toxin-antitoxin system RelE/ParE family toxin [Devosia sp. A16]|uniref:type II toxin-antitoxin system RelE/ParE family toxin n=1 Tax=Devosia sp. A16 TaxID=1736675 RepID=UPI0006D79A5A|nr:type II toxin-antitoxin system RelE/ParE family toxin [Devosia sp. A16]